MPLLERRKLSSSSTNFSNNRRRKRRPKPGNPNDFRNREAEPFFLTNIKVGSTLIFICSLYYGIQWLFWSPPSFDDGTISKETWKQYLGESHDTSHVEQKENSLKLPTFNLNDFNKNDPDDSLDTWDIAEIMKGPLSNLHSNADTNIMLTKVIDTLDQMRNEFSDLYGGINASRAMLRRGLHTFQPDGDHSDQSTNNNTSSNVNTDPFASFIKKEYGIFHTAAMILRAKEKKQPLRISFAGSSAVAGRGNNFKDSFPSVVQKLLSLPMKLLNVHIDVSNAAIGEISSFPYGWCLPNHLGIEANVVSWDSEMNQRRDSIAAFDSYLRNVVSMNQSPMLIIRESSKNSKREELLQNYVNLGVIHDPLVINTHEVYEPYSQVDESILPEGYKEFKEFKGPNVISRNVRTNLSLKEHELIGRMIVMHFCKAIQIVTTHLMLLEQNELNDESISLQKLLNSEMNKKPSHMLPDPQLNQATISIESESKSASSFTTGVLISSANNQSKHENLSSSLNWKMNPIFCRTSFEPVDPSTTLKEIVVSGTTAEDIDFKYPRGPMLYNKNWVLDLGEQDKRLMKLNSQYELGYKDMKKAYFGVPASGPLVMFVPYLNAKKRDDKQNEAIENESKVLNTESSIINANEKFYSIIICEIKQVKTQNTCDMERDLEIIVGGQRAKKVTYINSMGAAYMGQNLCIKVPIPEMAKLTTRSRLMKEIEELKQNKEGKNSKQGSEKKQIKKKKDQARLRLLKKKRNDPEKENIGVALEIRVDEGIVTWKGGPCTISHVIWEQKTPSNN